MHRQAKAGNPVFRYVRCGRVGYLFTTDPTAQFRSDFLWKDAETEPLHIAGHAARVLQGGKVSVYVLNMGQPVRIRELAERMIRLYGLQPETDVKIVYTGVRPGERTEEILFAQDEQSIPIGIPGIVAAGAAAPTLASMRGWLTDLRKAVAEDDKRAAYGILAAAVPDFKGKAA